MKIIMIAAVIATACSTPPENPEVPPADAADVTTVSLALGPLMAAPGEEDTVCVVLPLGNSTSQVIRGIRTNLTPGSHHMIITRASGVEQSMPQSCGPFGVSGDTLFIAEKADTELRYPDGSGLTVAANQMIGIEVHYINYVDTENPIAIIGTLELDMTPASSTRVRKVELLFTGNFSLSLPPRQATTVQSFHELSEGVEIFSLTSHTHSLGTYAAIHRARSTDDPDAMMIHESESWSEPPFDVFDPPLVLERSEGLRLTCEYFNPTDSEVTFGTDFDDEMCFMWVHYVVP